MPDLSTKGVHKFWQQYHDPMVYKIILFMEGVEQWTLDEILTLDSVLQELGTALDNIGYIDFQAEEQLIHLLIYTKMGRALLLLQAIDAAHPGGAAKLLQFAKEHATKPDDHNSIFTRRNLVLERLRILSRVFAPERLTHILQAVGGEKHA